MTASEEPNTVVRVLVGLIAAILTIGIITGVVEGLTSSVPQEKENLRDFVEGVNIVCEGEQEASDLLGKLGDHRINRSQRDAQKVYLVDSNEEIVETMDVDCPIRNDDFRLDKSYRVKTAEGGDAVVVSSLEESTQGEVS